MVEDGGTLIDYVTFRCPAGHEWPVPAFTTDVRFRLAVRDEDLNCSECGQRGVWIAEAAVSRGDPAPSDEAKP